MFLTTNCVENLLLFEDIRHEQDGYDSFPIEMPLYYFRYPAFNNRYSSRKISDEEEKFLNDAIKLTKQKMNYGNDENIVKEHLSKLEFLSLFSYFEAYLENIVNELYPSLSKKKKEAMTKVTETHTFRNVLKSVVTPLNSEIEKLLTSINPDFFEFIEFCRLVRNFHTHNLGIANQEFIDKCERQGLIIEEFRIRVDSNEKIYTGKKITNFYPIKYIALNKYISLQVLSFYFRNYVRELLFIIESSIAFKNQPRTLG
jgi:hypothetical protein